MCELADWAASIPSINSRPPPFSQLRPGRRRAPPPSRDARAWACWHEHAAVAQPVQILDRPLVHQPAPCGSPRRRRPSARPRSARGSTTAPSAARCPLAQQGAQPADALRVEPVQRLVQHQDLRVAEQRRRQPEPLAHARRVCPDPAAGGLARARRSRAPRRRARAAARPAPRASADDRAPSGRDGRRTARCRHRASARPGATDVDRRCR